MKAGSLEPGGMNMHGDVCLTERSRAAGYQEAKGKLGVGNTEAALAQDSSGQCSNSFLLCLIASPPPPFDSQHGYISSRTLQPT